MATPRARISTKAIRVKLPQVLIMSEATTNTPMLGESVDRVIISPPMPDISRFSLPAVSLTCIRTVPRSSDQSALQQSPCQSINRS